MSGLYCMQQLLQFADTCTYMYLGVANSLSCKVITIAQAQVGRKQMSIIEVVECIEV